MTRAWTLMTALPPTKGHMNLIRFAQGLPVKEVNVVVCTQPGEPFAPERFGAVWSAARHMPGGARVIVHWIHRPLPQDPNSDGFWEMWWGLMKTGDHGRFFEHKFEPGDFFVSSEPYGATLAAGVGGTFVPFDPGRELINTRATLIRQKPLAHFADIAEEFQHNLRTKVTIFGAESTGKTTLSKEVAALINGHWLYEWARPYLETAGPEITKESMEAIWRGQKAAQALTWTWYDKPYVIQDTDLFSTVGYWQQPHWQNDLGPCPLGLEIDAQDNESDLYIITRSNIPFETDPLRYGGDHRESPDEYWIDVAERYGLNYVVLDSSDANNRVGWAMHYAKQAAEGKTKPLHYERQFNETH